MLHLLKGLFCLVLPVLVFASRLIWPLSSKIKLLKSIHEIVIPPDEPEKTRAMMLVEKNAYVSAKRLLEVALTINPDLHNLLNYSAVLAKLGEYDIALEVVNKALLLDPTSEVALTNKASIESAICSKSD